MAITYRSVKGSNLTPNEVDTNFSDLVAVDATKAPLASPALTGTPTAPTAADGTNTTQIATTAHVFAGLATKAPVTPAAVTLTASTALTAAAHGNRQLLIAQAGATTQTINNDATGGWVAGSYIEIENTGAGTVTVAGGTATLLVGAGFSATVGPNTGGTFVRVGANTWMSLTPAAVAGSSTRKVWAGVSTSQAGAYYGAKVTVVIPANTLLGIGSSITFRGILKRNAGAVGIITVHPHITGLAYPIAGTSNLTTTQNSIVFESRMLMVTGTTAISVATTLSVPPTNTAVTAAVPAAFTFNPAISNNVEFLLNVPAGDTGEIAFWEVIAENPT